MKEELIKIYEFIRGDISINDFNNYFFQDIKFKEFFGDSFWLEIAECNFKNQDELYNIKNKLIIFADSLSNLTCNCIKIANIDAIDMFKAGEQHFNTITNIYDRGGHYWWLYVGLCEKCSQYWLIAQEERINDIIIFKRIDDVKYNEILSTNNWPSDFDKYIDLLRIGNKFGNKVRFIDPLEGFSVYATVKEIAEEEPNIRLTEIQELINLDKEDAEKICKYAMIESNVKINLKE